MLARIRKSWRGFVPAWRPHPRTLCAYYHCTRVRTDVGLCSRFCPEHAELYTREARALDDATKVVPFVVG